MPDAAPRRRGGRLLGHEAEVGNGIQAARRRGTICSAWPGGHGGKQQGSPGEQPGKRMDAQVVQDLAVGEPDAGTTDGQDGGTRDARRPEAWPRRRWGRAGRRFRFRDRGQGRASRECCRPAPGWGQRITAAQPDEGGECGGTEGPRDSGVGDGGQRNEPDAEEQAEVAVQQRGGEVRAAIVGGHHAQPAGVLMGGRGGAAQGQGQGQAGRRA